MIDTSWVGVGAVVKLAGWVVELVLADWVTVTLSVTDRLFETVTSCETEMEGEDEGAKVMLALALPDEAADDARDAVEEAVDEAVVISPDRSAACATASDERRVCDRRRQLGVAPVDMHFSALTANVVRQLSLIAGDVSEGELVDGGREGLARNSIYRLARRWQTGTLDRLMSLVLYRQPTHARPNPRRPRPRLLAPRDGLPGKTARPST